MAFELASRYYHIDQLLDPEDVNTNKPDKKSILMYVMCLYHAIDSISTHQLALSADLSGGSLQTLVQHSDHHSAEDEEINLLSEDASGADSRNSTGNNGSRAKSVEEEFEEIFHAGNLTDLDEISLAKSIDDLSNFPVPMNIKRSSTFTISTNESGFAALERSDAGSSSRPAEVDAEAASQTFQFFIESRSRPLSVATNASAEIGGYQNAIEVVLSLLLEAEEVLSRDLPEIVDMEDARQQFQAHEDFMVKLSEYQEYVGAALEEGARLLSEPLASTGLTTDDHNEIKHQMFLLNERWETLRMRALAVQSKVHGQLAEVQLRKIEELRVLLTQTEDRISRMAEISPSPDVIKLQLDEHKSLEASLNEQKVLVDELGNLVVIVNDDSFNDLEDRLSALGERWSHVVKWTKNRFERLQDTSYKWRMLTERYAIVRKWIDIREEDLKKMEQSTVTQIGSVMERMNNLRFCASDLAVLYDQLMQLQEIGQELQPAAQAFLVKLENLEDRCEALKEIVEVQQQRIEGMGFNFNYADGANDGAKIPTGWTDFQTKLNQTSRKSTISMTARDSEMGVLEDGPPSPQLSKKRKLQKSEKHQLLEDTIHEMASFVDESERQLVELNDIENLKEQRTILTSLDATLKTKIGAYAGVKGLMDECSVADDTLDLTSEGERITSIGSKYDELNFRLEHLLALNQTKMVHDKFQRNLTGFKLILADCQDWFKQYANVTSSTREDLENRLSYMDSLNVEIGEARDFCGSPESEDLVEWKNDFNQFYQSWSDIKSAVIRLIQAEYGGSIDIEDDESNPNESAIEKTICELEEEAAAVTVLISTLENMNANLVKLNSVKNRCAEIREQWSEASTEAPGDLWEKIESAVNERVIKQTAAIENANHFTSEYNSVMEFLKRIDRNMRGDLFILGEASDLEKLLKEYEAHEMEIKKADIDIISVKNFSETIMKSNEEKEEEKHLLELIAQLNEQFQKTSQLYSKNLASLKDTVKHTESILKDLKDTDAWLTDLEANTPKTQNAQIANANELFQLKSKFQILKEKCEQKAIEFRQLNEVGSERLMQIDEQLSQPKCQRKYSSLAKQFTKLSARWTDVTALVYTRTALLEHISGQLGELKTMIVSEGGYLDKLEKCLRKSPENAADAEEIYEELDVSFTLFYYDR